MAPPRRNSGCFDSQDSFKSVTMPGLSRAQAPVGIKVHIMRQRRSLACSQGAAYSASRHAFASETLYQSLHEATEQHEAAQQHASQEELQQQQHIVPVCASQGATAVGLDRQATTDAYAHLSKHAYAHSSSDLACACSDSLSRSIAGISSDSIIAGIDDDDDDNEDGSRFPSANHTDAELAEYLSSASLNTISPYNSAALLAGVATPPAAALSTLVSPFAAFASTANHAVAHSGEWTIGTSAAPQPELRHSSSHGTVVSTAEGDAATAAAHSENAADVTDPLLIAAHAAISAACAAAPPGTTTSGADLHTLLSSCSGGAVLLLGHGSTTISTQGAQLLSCASLDHLLQQHQASCSICSVQDPLQDHPQDCESEPVAAAAIQQEPDEQLQLPQQQNAQRSRRMGMVLQQQQITLQGLQRSRRMGMLVCRPVGSNSTGAQPAAATAVSQQTAAAAVAAASAAEDTSCSRSVIVLGVANSEAHPAAAAVPCCSAPTGQHRAAGAAVSTTAPRTISAHQHQQRQQQLLHGMPTPQPVMQLLSCSTLLSPCCSSTLLGSGNISCLRIGSINLSNLNALLGHPVPWQSSTAPAAAAPEASAAAAAGGGGVGPCSSAVLPTGAGELLGQSQRMLVLKACLGQQLQQLQEEQEQQASQEEQQQLIYLLD